jgi:hypothetical protein
LPCVNSADEKNKAQLETAAWNPSLWYLWGRNVFQIIVRG